MSTLYVKIDANGFADRENISIYEPDGDWRPFDPSFNGLYKPRYDDTAGRWVEGATPEEIEAMKPEPEPPQPTMQERIAQLEAELAAAREENLTAYEAIAELYEMLLAVQTTPEGGGSA